MIKTYVKPEMLVEREPLGLIPAVVVGLPILTASPSAAVVAGVVAGTPTLVMLSGPVYSASAVAALTKKGKNRFENWECLPALDIVEAYI